MPVQRVTMQPDCPECNKKAVEIFRYKDKESGKTAIVLKCGHITVEDAIRIREDTFFESLNGARPFAFQEESAKFAIESAHSRVLFAHEPGLGKTICAFRTLSLMDPEEAFPVLWVVKSALIPQFFKQIVTWLGYEHISQVIERGTDIPFKGFKHYIVSYDMLHRLKDGCWENIGIKTMVLDECQMIKSFGAKRTKGVFKVARLVKNLFALSGTPILNNAIEYFPVLHLLRPSKFPTRDGFIRYWIQMYGTRFQKPGGLKNPQKFKDYTSDFIIRYKKEEVLKDLPPITKGFEYCNMDDDLMEAYEKILKQFGDAYALNRDMGAANILAWMSKMRHLTGLSKIPDTIELVKEHLLGTDRKIVVFVEHIDVGDIMFSMLSDWCKENNQELPVRFEGGMSSDRIKEVTDAFESKARVMIASTRAAGEGLNLQFCSDCILHERQWNPPKEDQAFDRFHRIGQLNPVNVRIMTALNTIDDTMIDIVEGKRKYLKEALDNETYVWSETEMAKELAEAMFQKSTKLALKNAKSREDAAKAEVDVTMAATKFVENLKQTIMKDEAEENGNGN
jgi:SNF2 family DNA or RNA helicase